MKQRSAFSDSNYGMRVAGLEPARDCSREILSLLCLPIPPYPHLQKSFVRKYVQSVQSSRNIFSIKCTLAHSIKTTRMGFEPTTSAVTGRRSNQLSHRAKTRCHHLTSSSDDGLLCKITKNKNGPSGTRTQDRPVMSRLL